MSPFQPTPNYHTQLYLSHCSTHKPSIRYRFSSLSSPLLALNFGWRVFSKIWSEGSREKCHLAPSLRRGTFPYLGNLSSHWNCSCFELIPRNIHQMYIALYLCKGLVQKKAVYRQSLSKPISGNISMDILHLHYVSSICLYNTPLY